MIIPPGKQMSFYDVLFRGTRGSGGDCLFREPGVYRLRCFLNTGSVKVTSPPVDVSVVAGPTPKPEAIALARPLLSALSETAWQEIASSEVEKVSHSATDEELRDLARWMGAALAVAGAPDPAAAARARADLMGTLNDLRPVMREFATLRVAEMAYYRLHDRRLAQALLDAAAEPSNLHDMLQRTLDGERDELRRARIRAAAPWALSLVAAVLLGLTGRFWFIRTKRRARLAQGRCAACAYDLRGSKDSGRCPECGSPVSLRPTPLTSFF
jgi:hypothetical protein